MRLFLGRNYKGDYGWGYPLAATIRVTLDGAYWLFESSDDYFGAFHDTSWHFVRLNGD